jgi:predicted dehydrogenase
VSEERGPVSNEDIATFVAEFANGAAGTFSISRIALGHHNSLGFEVFGTNAAASFDLSVNAEFGYVDNAPDRVTNGWRRVIVGPDHPYIAAAQSMPFSGIGHGGQEFFTYQARSFLDEIAGLDRLPRQATFADGLRNMRVEEAIVKERDIWRRSEGSPLMAPLKIGILGAARIADDGIVEPSKVLGHRLVAVAARDRSRAEAFAANVASKRCTRRTRKSLTIQRSR